MQNEVYKTKYKIYFSLFCFFTQSNKKKEHVKKIKGVQYLTCMQFNICESPEINHLHAMQVLHKLANKRGSPCVIFGKNDTEKKPNRFITWNLCILAHVSKFATVMQSLFYTVTCTQDIYHHSCLFFEK